MYKTKKEMYNESSYDMRTYINGELAIKAFYYLRNGLLHVRYTVDRCIELSENEERELKERITEKPYDKQNIFSEVWKFQTNFREKPVIMDGLREFERRMKGTTAFKGTRNDRH